MLDYIGVGFGPSNLALAVAFREIAPWRTGLFFEQAPELDWHGGLLFEHSRLQISFLKDLATLRNPASRFGFLAYLKSAGRLEVFANLREFHPTRLEYLNYLRWAAAAFANQTAYSTRVLSVSPEGRDEIDHFTVETEDEVGLRSRYRARNVIAATGGVPRVPEECRTASGQVFHASGFLHTMPRLFPDADRPLHLLIAGDGQSAAEVALELLRRYPNATIEMLSRGYSLHASDSTPFLNAAFGSDEAARYHAAPSGERAAILRDLRSTNYGVVDADLLELLYRAAYAMRVAGRERLAVRGFSRLESVRDSDGALVARVVDRIAGGESEVACDGVILATGYDRRLDPHVFAPVLALLQPHEGEMPATCPAGSLALGRPGHARLYVQGVAEEAHGIGDSLLSLLAFRSEAIVRDLDGQAGQRAAPIYPPPQHVERDETLLTELIRRHPFATLALADDRGDPVVTQLPLVMGECRNSGLRLFGHLDRRNPQAALLDGRSAVAVFHGGDAYISPTVYATDQLPTWNSLSVHLRGRVRLVSERAAVVAGLQSISAQAETGGSPFRLNSHDPRIEALIGGIVGFEFEVEAMSGRFKLSQDRNADDCRSAAEVLCARHEGLRDLVAVSLADSCPGIAAESPAGDIPPNQIQEGGMNGVGSSRTG